MNDDWVQIAESLPMGAKIRVRCCASDNSMVVSHSEKGYLRYCFRCGNEGEQRFVPHGLRSISDIERHKREKLLMQQTELKLPDDFTYEIPARNSVWFMQYGISPELARLHGIGYSPEFDRVVLPVRNFCGELEAVQMRHLDKKPKYLNMPGGYGHALWHSSRSMDNAVIVEDILSAIKIGRRCGAISILGSDMTDERAARIASVSQSVTIWFDGDQAGQRGRKVAEKKLRLLGLPVSHVFSEKDPKDYSLMEIEERLDVRHSIT